MCYETKQAMPERLVMTYVYGLTPKLPAVEGQTSGTFVDYALHDYKVGYDLSTNYPGMPRFSNAFFITLSVPITNL